MSAAEKRVAELLERWRISVELHARYLALDDAAYAAVQDWPKHQRPTRWVVDVARSRLLELKRVADERHSRGDASFAEALELMAFLTNLLGAEHVERFVPLAQPQAEPKQPPVAPAEPANADRAEERPVETRPARPAAPPRQARRGKPQRAEPRPAPIADEPTVGDKATATVIADAVRLISWGREWPQLAGLIARLANRPSEADVWKILREHRADIETRARRPRD